MRAPRQQRRRRQTSASAAPHFSSSQGAVEQVDSTSPPDARFIGILSSGTQSHAHSPSRRIIHVPSISSSVCHMLLMSPMKPSRTHSIILRRASSRGVAGGRGETQTVYRSLNTAERRGRGHARGRLHAAAGSRQQGQAVRRAHSRAAVVLARSGRWPVVSPKVACTSPVVTPS